MKLAMTLNCWPLTRQQQQQQLDQLATLPVQRIFLGETVCEKRDRVALRGLLELADGLAQQGKQLVLSTLNLVNGPRELKLVEQVCQQTKMLVEANDYTAVRLLTEMKQPFWASANLNLYNLDTLSWLHDLGAQGFVPPIDISDKNATRLFEEAATWLPNLEREIIGFGWPQLSVSARCATARIQGRNRDNCDKVCQQHCTPVADTLEGERLLYINGPQTHGVNAVNRFAEARHWHNLNTHWLRIIPGPSLNFDWMTPLCDSDGLVKVAEVESNLHLEIPTPESNIAIG
ncbi:U32 family peptidase [Ferrimonas aestuarii]|uniref:U32 family peptidase n=1 Tax=Ferrimonas aestuarii TaxID=2569539 RepID=A0A4U1BEU6_9GAMM|nr:U32 family peptidase [Ferrimonas aestuarii]TKB49601.1 hypothetical protein FCL42_20360 [Ferrimonas aestuarii]